MNPKTNLTELRVFPLAERTSLARVEDILVNPEDSAPPCSRQAQQTIEQCAAEVAAARARGAAVILMYGAHLLRNGASLIMEAMIKGGWLTHLATNGAGVIHDWEYAFLGRSTEDVRANVASGTFGTWDETGRYFNLAALIGGIEARGLGKAMGQLIAAEGLNIPDPKHLAHAIRERPDHRLSSARADLLYAIRQHDIKPGWHAVPHPWKHSSVICQAYLAKIPLTVHPGIGYDIISNHPWFNGAAIGRGAGIDFARIVEAVEGLDGGVVMSIGSAIMAPQVFEKSLSCVNNLRIQKGRTAVKNHRIFVVDLQDGGQWDWQHGEPPKSSPAYYLRFCKSFSRMGAPMHYAECDNLVYLHNLYARLKATHP